MYIYIYIYIKTFYVLFFVNVTTYNSYNIKDEAFKHVVYFHL